MINGLSVLRNDDNREHTVKLLVPAGSALIYHLSDVNGDISIDGANADTLDLKGVNTKITLANLTAKDGVSFQNVNGSSTLTKVNAPSLTIRSLVNGSCNVSASGFKSIDAAGAVNSRLTLTGLTKPED